MVALRRLIPYFRPYRWSVVAGLAFVISASAAANMIPALLERAIDIMRGEGNGGDVRNVAIVMLITAAVAGVLRFGMRELLNSISRRIETDLRHDVFAHLTRLDAAWFATMRTGDLMARLTNDVQAVRMAAGPAIMYMVNTIFGAIFALFMMTRISGTLTISALLPMIGLPALMIWLGRAVHQRFEAVQEQFSHLTTRAQENLSGVRVVRAYQQEAAEAARFAALGEEYLQRNISLAKINGIMNPGFGLLAGLGGAVTIGVGGRLLIEGQITVGGFVAFGIYLAMLTWPLIALGWTTNLFQRGAASMGRVLQLLDSAPHDVHDTGTVALPATRAGRGLEFRNVWFHYPTQEVHAEPRWVLRDVSFTIPAGGTLAVVGATGSGKSALMDLIPRVFEPQRGDILLDGVSIRDVPLETLRAEIGYVPQESLLFSETIGTNVAYGLAPLPSLVRTAEHPVPRGDDVLPEVLEATQVAQLADTIAALPEGFATRLGERGINLSGGQKQRASIARALARRPHVVLLDDALSAVDTSTEAAILAGLRRALAGRTALIASHRVSTVRDADLIIVLENGEIVERGTHGDLFERNGRYTELLRRQQLLEQLDAA